ncbi:hypothetical protein BBO99_00004818 [Phytophthora kernoviae]|uniref:Nicastrin n=1 Tax=Phytophthora kernoviae TaxID=325452 RepID=A0A3R7NGE9_9STRA|nr:hypothetical protein BBO99_00004818 [Phytophthora kernoviae]
MLRKEEVVANLANFAYDPINYVSLNRLRIMDLFLDILDADQEQQQDTEGSNQAADKQQGPATIEKELRACATYLGLSSDHVQVLEDPKLQDGMESQWDVPHIAAIVAAYVDKHSIDVVFTFDDYGVSGHANHIATHFGVKRALQQQQERCNAAESDEKIVRGWGLESTSLVRKYVGILDTALSYWLSRQDGEQDERQFVFVFRPRWNYNAMAMHQSQFVWYRRLFVAFSRYTFINTFRSLLPSADLSADQKKKHTPCAKWAPEHLVTTGGECVRLFHSGGSVGCRSVTDSEMARLYPISTFEELSSFVSGQAEQQEADSKYVLVMKESLLSYDAISSGLDRIGGLFVYPESSKNASFEASTPQGDGTVDGILNPFSSKKTEWNPTGNGLLTKSLPFPVVMLENTTTGEEFTKRAEMNIKSGVGATYKAFMNYYFGPEDMNSLKCLNFTNIYGNPSPKCDPIGGQSSWAMRGKLDSEEIVLAMAGMDSAALSHVLSPGANTGASGLVALLTAAHALKGLPDSAFDKKVVFAAFQAEKFGFVGSRKFLSDVQKFTKDPEGACAYPVSDSSSPMGKSFCTNPMLSSTEFANLELSKVSYAIAVDQVGILPSSGNFTVHVNPHANETSDLVDAIVNAPSAASAFAEGNTGSLPPTPLLSFVNDAEYGQRDLVGAVIAGYGDSFTSEATYNSRHDEFTLLDVDAVAQAAQVLAESVFTLASSNATTAQLDKIKVDTSLVENMLLCVSTDWSCDLMTNYSQFMVTTLIDYLSLTDSAKPSYSVPATLYPGPLDDDRSMLVLKTSDSSYYSLFNESWSDDEYAVRLFPNAYESFTRAFLASAMVPNATAEGATTCTQSQSCGDGGKGKECVYPGICVDKSAFHHEASSPGLKRTTTALLYEVVNSSLPIWVEPQWASDIGSYSFPDPGAWIGWITLFIGLGATGAGVGVSFLVLGSVQKMKLM